MLGRFIQPDTIVPNPGDPQSLNRYSYAANNPVRYTDPSGHYEFEEDPNDPYVWRRDKPEKTLIRTAKPVVNWQETQEGDILLPAKVIFGGAVVTVAGEAVLFDLAVPVAQAGWLKLLEALGVACADGDCGNEVQSVWQLRPWERGRVIEATLGRSPELAENFPVIDRFENGVATSIKSIDLHAATYQDTTRLAGTVTRYLNTLAQWNGQTRPWGGFQIFPSEIQTKVLELAVPPGGSPSQWRTLIQLQQAATELGVRLDIVIFH